ncbi:MAG: anti-sigma factor [Candidatus Pristimantibacillus sp.]
MTCQEVIEYMHRQLDGDLDEQEHEVLLKHTRHCPDCAAMFERLKMLSVELENLPRVMPSYSLVDAILPQLEQLHPQQKSDAASTEDTQEQQISRRKKPARNWSAFRTLSGIVAASVVAGLFIFSYNSGLFQSNSSNDSASKMSAANESSPQEASAFDLNNADVQPFAADSSRSGEVNVESLSEESPTDGAQEGAAASPTAKKNSLNSEDIEKETVYTSKSESDESTDGAAMGVTGGPAPIEVVSTDGVYTAQVSGYVIRLFKTDSTDVLFESRKNGKITNLTWSEDNKKLSYEIHMGQSSIENFVIDTATFKESKAVPE